MGIYQRKRVKIRCLGCDIIVEKRIKEVKKRSHGSFCSKQCFDAWQTGESTKFLVACKNCGTQLIRSKNKSIPKYGYFCSVICSNKYLWRMGVLHQEKNMNKRVEYYCKNCGHIVCVRKSIYYRRGTRAFCSKLCGIEWRAKQGWHTSSLEIKLKAELNKTNMVFGWQKGVMGYIVDFIVETKIVVECDGKYWHSLSHIIKKDEEENKKLVAGGYIIIRLQEQTIKRAIGECMRVIESAVAQRAMGVSSGILLRV
jgi:very-short-patch-repair endonuclease